MISLTPFEKIVDQCNLCPLPSFEQKVFNFNQFSWAIEIKVELCLFLFIQFSSRSPNYSNPVCHYASKTTNITSCLLFSYGVQTSSDTPAQLRTF